MSLNEVERIHHDRDLDKPCQFFPAEPDNTDNLRHYYIVFIMSFTLDLFKYWKYDGESQAGGRVFSNV